MGLWFSNAPQIELHFEEAAVKKNWRQRLSWVCLVPDVCNVKVEGCSKKED